MKTTLYRWFAILWVMLAGGNLLPLAAQVATPVVATSHTFELFPVNVLLFRLINDHYLPALDPFFAHVGQYAGNGWICLPVTILVYFLLRRQCGVLLFALAVETAVVQVLKDVCAQWRPGVILEHVHQIAHLRRGSFPSGDAAMAWVIVCALWPASPRWLRVVLACYGVFVVYERVYIGVHFPLDVTAGALVGILCVLLCTFILNRATKHPQPSTEPEVNVPVP